MVTVEIDGRAAGLRASLAHFVVGHPKCGHLHGHDVSLSARISAHDLDKFGFVLDFSYVKDAMREFLKMIDHKGIIVSERDVERTLPLGIDDVKVHNGDEIYVLPEKAITSLPISGTTAEAMAQLALDFVVLAIPKDELIRLSKIEVTYWETNSTGATAMWEKKP